MIAEFSEWVSRVSEKLAVFADLDIGYPKGENRVLPPVAVWNGNVEGLGLSDENRNSLVAFYATCDGFSFPDVSEGIFVVGQAKLRSAGNAYVPERVDGHEWQVLAIGTFGDGSYIVMRTDTGEVLRLPPSKIQDNVYYENPKTPMRMLAPDFRAFLESVAASIPQTQEEL